MNITKPTCVLLCVLTLLACQEKEEKKVSRGDLKILDVGDPKDTLTIKSVPISVRECSERILELLSHWPLEKIATNLSIGGYFHANQFKISGDSAVILWNCYNPGGNPELFVAVEEVPKYDTTVAPPTTPLANELYIPVNTFRYNGSSNTAEDTEKFMVKAVNPTISIPPPRKIGKKEVEQYVANFKSMVATLEVISGAKYSAHPLAAFGYNTYYRNFEDRPHKFVVYFYTLYFDTSHQPNYFRPVLGVTMNDGTLIQTKDLNEPMLQKSWPPPPN
jgi:hypothetical protein